MGLREAARPHVTLSSSRMRGNAPGLCPHTTTGRCVQQLAVRHRYHGPAYHQANRLDECDTYIILVLPPSLRQPAGKRLHRQPMPRKIGPQVRASDGLRVRRICPRSSPAVSHMPPRRATAGVGPTSVVHTRSLRFSVRRACKCRRVRQSRRQGLIPAARIPRHSRHRPP